MNKNILNKILLATLPFMAISANAATPQSFNYQSVVRTSSGTVVANETVYVKVEILRDNSGSYEVVYSEMHNAQTNANGSFAIKIGEGSVLSGSFSTIDWSASSYAVRTSTATNAELTDAAIATSGLSSVPYALYALKSADSFSGYWEDLKEKPNMSEYAKIGDVAAYAADSTRKLLGDYATKDDVLDLHNRAIRASNYRIDSLKSVASANDYYIAELKSDAAKYATKSEIASFVGKDTLSSYATKANVSALSKSTTESIAELTQTVSTNKQMCEANNNNLREIQKLYAKKDTMYHFVGKEEMVNYATAETVNTLDNSINFLTQSLGSTDTKLGSLAVTVNNLSTTVAENQKADNQRIDAVQTELDKVDDKIAASERKLEASDINMTNKISANEGSISRITTKVNQMENSLSADISNLNLAISNNSKRSSASIDSLAKVVTSNGLAASKDTKSKTDSLAKAIDAKLKTLDTDIKGVISKLETSINGDIEDINTTLISQSSALASANTQIANLNGMIKSISTWADGVDKTNKNLTSELNAFKTKYKSDSLKMEKRILTDSLKVDLKYREMKDLALQYMSQANTYKDKLDNIEAKLGGKTIDVYVEDKINAALKAAKLDDIETTVDEKVSAALTAAKLDDIETTVDEKVSAALTAAKLQELIEKVGKLEEELKTLKGEE